MNCTCLQGQPLGTLCHRGNFAHSEHHSSFRTLSAGLICHLSLDSSGDIERCQGATTYPSLAGNSFVSQIYGDAATSQDRNLRLSEPMKIVNNEQSGRVVGAGVGAESRARARAPGLGLLIGLPY